jgi:hypothetical protein
MASSRPSILRSPIRCRSYGAARFLVWRSYKYFAPTEHVSIRNTNGSQY